jgi:signal transduction histidine kinase
MRSNGLRSQKHVRLLRRSRWRLVLPAGLVVSGLLAVLATGIYLLSERSVYHQLETRLAKLASEARGVGEPGGSLVFDERDHLLSMRPLPIDERGEAFQFLRQPRLGTLAALRLPLISNGPHVVAMTAENDLRVLAEVRHTLLSLTVLAIVVALFGGYVLAGVALRPLDDAVRERSELVALVAHQLRTPLSIVRTSAELARDGRAVTPLEAMSTILKQAERMEGLAERLTDLARAESAPRSTAVAADLAVAAASAVSSLGVLAERAGVRIDAEVPPGLSIRAEPGEATEVLAAVLDNAIKFSRRGGTVSLRARAERGRAAIEVRDQGAGIAAADLPFVAEPFFQGGRVRGGGHGLGLAIAHAIAERRGGQISIASAPGRGTTVRVVLPLAGRTVAHRRANPQSNRRLRWGFLP